MALVFGFDIGTTSIGFAAIEFDAQNQSGSILRMGTRIFPEARDPDGTPLNQTRRTKRMMRRQLRRRRDRRRLLNETLAEAGLLPLFASGDWPRVMIADPIELRTRGLNEPLTPTELGRALYHLAKRRHYQGRDLADDGTSPESDSNGGEAADEKAARTGRETTVAALKASGQTLGQHISLLHQRDPKSRKRGVHALRHHIKDEFERLWLAQTPHHPALSDPNLKAHVSDVIFSQRPVFWRLNTLGKCRLEPDAELAAKGGWLSAQRRMLEKLNNLQIAGGNARPLDDEERAAILAGLQTQQSMSWGGVRTALKPIFKAKGLGTDTVRFNLELGGEPKLLGNPVEQKLAAVFGPDWDNHPHKTAIREASHNRLWAADYGKIGSQRVVIKRSQERAADRRKAAESFANDFGATAEQVSRLESLSFPTGWDAFSVSAIEKLLPELEAGRKMGELLAGPDYSQWRQKTFPRMEAPTGEILDRLPSPKDKDEAARISQLRNPTVVRTQNELRKVVNNLIDFCGRKPDLIRVELARDLGKGKKEREEIQSAIRKQENRRKDAIKDLQKNGIAEPAHRDIEKWLLWKECQGKDPYTGDQIGFSELFLEGQFEVEHIWPRSRSLDDSFRNKTLCRKDVNQTKGNRTPFECFQNKPDQWDHIKLRLQGMIATRAGDGMSPGKVKRFLAESMPDDFASRQLNDTGYAGRQAIGQLKRLWPDVGPMAPVNVQPVNGKVTAHLRKLWGLNHILGDTGEKNRADHRHHAIDALTIACTHPGVTNQLSRYWQIKDDPRQGGGEGPHIAPPWPTIRADAERAVAAIVVSHKVRKKVSGPLHKETIYGDTGEDTQTKTGTYREFVRRKQVEVLTKGEYDDIRDPHIRKVMQDWLAENGGDPKKINWKSYPRVSPNGPEIKRVRILVRQQIKLMAPVSTGYADLGSNHHIAIYQRPDGKAEFEVVSLFEASRRLARREPIVRREREGARFVMSLAAGDHIEVPTGEKCGRWTVKKLSGNGQVYLKRHTDATPAKENLWGPGPNAFVSEAFLKRSIDPIGRVKPAND
jgi:CRISPR-associated endonuclease Csn1